MRVCIEQNILIERNKIIDLDYSRKLFYLLSQVLYNYKNNQIDYYLTEITLVRVNFHCDIIYSVLPTCKKH